jgi:3-deoxy-D-arabino-heptulosonate 7-phosphate (DAHP) synthase
VHPDPAHARCDGPQSVDIPAFEALMAALAPVAALEGRRL